MADNAWLATKNDGLYNSGEAISVGAQPRATSTHVGTELELITESKQNKRVTYGFDLAHLFTGEFLNETTRGKDYSYPFAYLTFVF